MVIELNDSNFEEEVLKSDKIVLVDMFATWCEPCQIMSPIVEEISEENLPNVKVCKLNVDDAQDTAINFGVMSIPTFLVFKNGEVVKTFVGITEKEELIKAINS